MTKTPDEILAFLIRHAKPDEFSPVEFPASVDSQPVYPLHDLLLRLSDVTRYRVPIEDFENFVGEKYSFEKHMRSLSDEGTLTFTVAGPGDIYDSENYRKAFDHTNGLTADYKCNPKKCWITFRIRTHRYEFLNRFKQIQQNAHDLGLKERRPIKYKGD